MGQHYLDPVQYLLEKDQESPVSIEVDAPQQHYDAVGTWRRITYTYADGCQIVLDGANDDTRAPFLEGPAGKLYPELRTDRIEVDKLLAYLPDPEPVITTFSESVLTRQKFALNEVNGHRSCTLVNLGKIAVRLGRNLNFDSASQRFVDDPGANEMIDQPMRGAWKMEL